MTTSELIALLSEYPADTLVMDGKGYELRQSSVGEHNYDVYDGPKDDQGYEMPTVHVGVSIGPRF